MSQFIHYKSSIDTNVKAALKQGINFRGADPAREYFKQIIKMDPDGSFVGTKVLFEEWEWRRTGRRTIFVDSRELPAQVFKIPLRGEILPVLKKWGGHFAFSFLQGSKVEGVELPGILVSFSSMEERIKLRTDALREVYGPGTIVDVDTRPVDSLFVSYNKSPHLFCVMTPADKIQEMLQGRTEWLAEHDFSKRFESLGLNLPTSREEHQMQCLFSRVVCGLILYAEAFPGSLRDGLPTGHSKHELGKEHMHSKRLMTLSGPKRSGPTEPFFRIGHFRTLRAKRFRRDEQGNVRVIPVRATVIGGKLKAQTMEDENARGGEDEGKL